MEGNSKRKEAPGETSDASLLIKCEFARTYIDTDQKKGMSNCRQFSMRAYVAEIRMKDWKICWPFHSFGKNLDSDKQEHMPPPLLMPDFSQHCSTKSSEEENFKEINSEFNSFPRTTVYEKDPRTRLGMEQLDPLDVVGKGKVDAVTERIWFGSHATKATASSARTTFEGEQLHKPHKPNSGKFEIEFSNRNTNQGSKSAKIHSKGKIVNTISKLADKRVKQLEALSCPESKLCNIKANITTDRKDVVDDQWDDKSSRSINSRKPYSGKAQKFRLLADIIRSEILGTSTELPRSYASAHSSIINTAARDTEDAHERRGFIHGPLLRNQLDFQEYVQENSKKRKKLRVRESNSIPLLPPSKASKDFKFCKSDGVNNSNVSVISGSTSISGKLVNSDIYSISHNHSEKSRVDGLVCQSRKFQSDGRQSNLAGSQEGIRHKSQRGIRCNSTRIGTLFEKDKPAKRRLCPAKVCTKKSSSEGMPMCHVLSKDVQVCTVDAASVCHSKYTNCMKEWSSEDQSLPHNLSRGVQFYTNSAPSSYRSGSSCLTTKTCPCKMPKILHLPYNNDINTGGHSEVINNQYSVAAKRVCEQEVIDDIPMEIVELLAKNRRKRRILEAVCVNNNNRWASATKKSKKLTRAYPPDEKSLTYPPDENIQVLGDSMYSTAGRRAQPIELINHNSYYRERKADVRILKKPNAEHTCACMQKKIKNCPKLVAPLDYENETIPAMQLLRLSDPRMSSKASLNAISLNESLTKNMEAEINSPSEQTLICSVNRNPADFSIPDAENEFMRSNDIELRNKVVTNQVIYSFNRSPVESTTGLAFVESC